VGSDVGMIYAANLTVFVVLLLLYQLLHNTERSAFPDNYVKTENYWSLCSTETFDVNHMIVSNLSSACF